MKILIACEESQAVTSELRFLGHEAYSCDIQDTSGQYPEYHIKSDVLPLLNGYTSFHTTDGKKHNINSNWDMIIGFPPCTYMAASSACRMYQNKKVNLERYNKAMQAKIFFLQIYNADCKKIAIENPVPLSIIELPKYNQLIQPYYFGDPYSKRTCLWLKGLPPLMPTCFDYDYTYWVSSNKNYKGIQSSAKMRAKTFPGIAKAMARQWTGCAFYDI